MSKTKKPPRKGMTSFSAEEMEENGDVFVVLELHHGLGESTRVDLDLGSIEPLVRRLRIACREAKALRCKPKTRCVRCADFLHIKNCPRCGRSCSCYSRGSTKPLRR